MITRRSFMEMFGLTVAGLSLNGKVFGKSFRKDDLFRIPAASMSDPVFSFTSAHFTPFINSGFRVSQNDSETSLRLIDVAVLERKENLAKGAVGESFSLLFRGGTDVKLAGKRAAFSHPSLGAFMLFLSPVNDDPYTYEAIVNHLEARASR